MSFKLKNMSITLQLYSVRECPYGSIGAAMGWNIGVMRSSLNKELTIYDFDPQRLSRKTTEIQRAVRWRIWRRHFPFVQQRRT